MSHTENTFDKKKMRENPNPLVKKTEMKLRSFIKNSGIREFFANA
jgi:hypothetical protein